MDLNLRNKVVIVTGASGVIGTAVSQALLDCGTNIVINDLSSNQLSDSVKLNARGGNTVEAYGDITGPHMPKNIIQAALNVFGRVDSLIHCVGTQRHRLIYDMSEGDWDYVLDSNLYSSFSMIRAFTKHLSDVSKPGSIVLLSSGCAGGGTGQSNYCSAKAGLIGLANGVSRDMVRHGITCNVVLPGLTANGQGIMPYVEERDVRYILPLLLYLLSPSSSHLTGKTFAMIGNRLSQVKTLFSEQEVFFSGEWGMDELGEAMNLLSLT